MQHFTKQHIGMEVHDQHDERIGKIEGVQDGVALLKAKTGVEARKGESANPETEALDVRPEQVVTVVDDVVTVSLEDA